MKLLYDNVDVLSKNLPNIVNPKILKNNKFTPDGLFSEIIFGPASSYCQKCNRHRYVSKDNQLLHTKCDKCGIVFSQSDVRSKIFAKIELPFKIVNPILLYIFFKLKPSYKTIVKNMLEFSAAYKFDDNDLVPVKNVKDTSDGVLIGPNGVYSLILSTIEDRADKYSAFLFQHKSSILINNVIVIPPAFRPCVKSNSIFMSDKLNDLYQNILKHVKAYKKVPIDCLESEDIYRTFFKYVQNSTLSLYNFIIEKLSKKDGIIREGILGKRVDFSGRAVVTPGPDLSLNECSLPYKMVLELFKPFLTEYLLKIRLSDKYTDIVDKIDSDIVNGTYELWDHVCAYTNGLQCIVNRQPTLHRMSILGFNIKINKTDTIRMPAMANTPLGMDYDGDNVAIYIPVTKESVIDLKERLIISKNIISPATGESVIEPNQDIVLGVYHVTKNVKGKSVVYKGVTLTEGEVLFNNCLPVNFYPIEGIVDKKILKEIIKFIAYNYSSDIFVETIDKITKLGFKYSTKAGYTLSISDIYSKPLLDAAEKLDGNNPIKDMNTLATDKDIISELHKLPISTYIDSGSRGTWKQAIQLVLTRGYVADSSNNICQNIIRSCLVKGLTPNEFFDSSQGTRKSLLDTTFATGATGYLNRQLVYSTLHTELIDSKLADKDPKLDDCGTTDGIKIDLSSNDLFSKKLAESIIDRWYKVIPSRGKISSEWKLLTHDNIKSVLGKKLLVRSPIYCSNDKICRKCYGELHKIVRSKNISIVASTTICERILQLVLQTFHHSGSASASKTKKNTDVVSAMEIIGTILHKPSLFIGQGKDPFKIVMELFNIFNQYSNIRLVHFETVVSSLIWTEDEKCWRLSNNRNSIDKQFVSILKIPSMVNWMTGLAFSNLKRKLLDGIVDGKTAETNCISRLFE